MTDILIVSKETQLDYDAKGYGFAASIYQKMNHADVSKIREAHDKHYQKLDMVVEAFSEFGVDPVVRERENLGARDTERKWDFVVPFGGDRTFMNLARYIDDDTKVFGILSNEISTGAHYNSNMSTYMEDIKKLLEGQYRVEQRTRIKGIVNIGDGFHELAVNDIFIGKQYTMSYSRVWVEKGGKTSKMGSSGLLVSTYWGQSGWYNNIGTIRKDKTIDADVLEALGFPSGTGFTDADADFKPEDRDVLRYKSINTKEIEGDEFGVIRDGEELDVTCKVRGGGVISFDGVEPKAGIARCYALPYDSTVTIKIADIPLHVVSFDRS